MIFSQTVPEAENDTYWLAIHYATGKAHLLHYTARNGWHLAAEHCEENDWSTKVREASFNAFSQVQMEKPKEIDYQQFSHVMYLPEYSSEVVAMLIQRGPQKGTYEIKVEGSFKVVAVSLLRPMTESEKIDFMNELHR